MLKHFTKHLNTYKLATKNGTKPSIKTFTGYCGLQAQNFYY